MRRRRAGEPTVDVPAKGSGADELRRGSVGGVDHLHVRAADSVLGSERRSFDVITHV